MLCGAHPLYSLDPKLRCCCFCCTYFLAHAAAACLLHFSLSLYVSHLCLFSTKNNLAKLKGLLRVQPDGRRKDEPQRGFISVRYYDVYWGSKHACDKNRRSSVTYASISSVFPPHPTPFSRTTKYIVVLRKIRAHLDLLSIPRLWGGKCQNV